MSRQEYGAQLQSVQPVFWQGVMVAMVNIMILIALGSWAFSQVKKAVKGEEVARPF